MRERLPTPEEIREEDDPKALAKFFHPTSGWSWYATAFDPEREIFLGLVDGQFLEYGTFSLAELEKASGALGLGVERDRFFDPLPISKLREKLERGEHV
ncbi:DUF2958 domain-containing protein [Halarsenatibacter silvermanii]|nr:DUF2958 domain-containing protein [Halarsenatibacter silvermanii]